MGKIALLACGIVAYVYGVPIWLIILSEITIMVGVILANADQANRKHFIQRLSFTRDRLWEEPTVEENQTNLLAVLHSTLNFTPFELSLAGLSSDSLYREALELVGNHPQCVGLRDLALKVGRWHDSRSRDDRQPTIYDEQAIQNDLLVRMAHKAV